MLEQSLLDVFCLLFIDFRAPLAPVIGRGAGCLCVTDAVMALFHSAVTLAEL